jgi:YVTN family beta-propeller protein
MYVEINKEAKTVLPNGRFITPAGKTHEVAPHPYGLILSPDGHIAVTSNSGTNPLSISILRDITSENPEIQQVPPGSSTDEGVLASVFMGLAISNDNSTVYVAGGQENKIFIFDLMTGASNGYIDCSYIDSDNDYSHGYIGDMVLSKDGFTLYVVDQINFRMVIIDLQSEKILHNVPVGRYPFGITLSPDNKKAYVANVGMFAYQKIKGIDPKNMKDTGLKFPPFGYDTKEAEEGIKTDSLEIPGLGDVNAPEAFSVFTIDLQNSSGPEVTAKIKTGHLVGAMVEGIPAVGGSSPNSLVATDDYVFVSNGNNDNISVIDIKKDTISHEIELKPDSRIKSFRGIIPFGLALSPDNKRLYVAEAGINAVAVVDIPSLKVLGHIPTGWFPSKLRVTPDGKHLVVANAKGYGSGPNAGPKFDPFLYGSYIGSLIRGSVSVIPIPDDTKLESLSKKVIENNFNMLRSSAPEFKGRDKNPVPLYPGEKITPIKHIVFISKENRTYDEVFGQVAQGTGMKELARYGKDVSIRYKGMAESIDHLTVMPNHLQLAKEFAISDNFYVDADVSADGHRWLVNTYPNEWVETSTAASYGGNRTYKSDSKAPGVYAMNGSAGAIYPEDYNEAGSMWDHLERNDVDFYNFGFSIMFEPASYQEDFKYTGIRHYINFPVPQPIFERTSRTYPTYNMAIPDQFRIDMFIMFIKEFNEKWMKGEDSMPAIITVIIPNDHGADDRPEAGFPYRESYMADNDLAVGRIVEFLSHTPYWKNMMIIITEDDAQNGVDHIDAHRSLLMVISPYVKRDFVSHMHYSFGSLFKTFWNILGLPYLNQYDAGATDLADFFTDQPDFTPYSALNVDERIFRPQDALDPFDENFDWTAIEESPELDNVDDMLNESKERDEYRLNDQQ